MYFRALNVLFVLLGLFLSSPTLKASFCDAKPLKQIYRERISFEKKVHKPFESFYAAKAKRSFLNGHEFTTPSLDLGSFTLNSLTFIFIAFEGASLPNLHHSFHPQRGPPVI